MRRRSAPGDGLAKRGGGPRRRARGPRKGRGRGRLAEEVWQGRASALVLCGPSRRQLATPFGLTVAGCARVVVNDLHQRGRGVQRRWDVEGIEREVEVGGSRRRCIRRRVCRLLCRLRRRQSCLRGWPWRRRRVAPSVVVDDENATAPAGVANVAPHAGASSRGAGNGSGRSSVDGSGSRPLGRGLGIQRHGGGGGVFAASIAANCTADSATVA